eukprot:scaffold4655_cov31-Tisochrysis_lutea.AAC.1
MAVLSALRSCWCCRNGGNLRSARHNSTSSNTTNNCNFLIVLNQLTWGRRLTRLQSEIISHILNTFAYDLGTGAKCSKWHRRCQEA